MEVGCVDADTIMDDEGELRQEVGGHPWPHGQRWRRGESA
jgi:hypothetical protein